jgi:hypothetical protein
MRVPSRGSAASLAFGVWARTARTFRPNEAFHRVHTIYRGSASVLVWPDVETEQTSGFAKTIDLFGSLALPVLRPIGKILYFFANILLQFRTENLYTHQVKFPESV